MPFKLYPEKNNYLHKTQWLNFIKIGPENAEIPSSSRATRTQNFLRHPTIVGGI